MSQYDIFEHKVFGKKAVKTGFSAGAFFYTLIWALIYRMWPLATILFIWAMVAAAMDVILSNLGGHGLAGALFAQFVFYHLPAGLFFGFAGNSLIKSQLLKQGYEKVAEIEAMSVEDALGKSAGKQPFPHGQVSPTLNQNINNKDDIADKLIKINNLLKQGAINEEEYQAAKSKILNL